MTFKKQFIAVIKCQTQILREVDNVVHLPFGEHFSIFLKNLETRKAQVEISIDGKSIGSTIIVPPNSEIEIERFLDDVNTGNKFKFIRKTNKIVQVRGDRVDDGIVRVQFTFETEKPEVEHVRIEYYDPPYYRPWRQPCIIRGTYDPPYYTCNSQSVGVSTGNSLHSMQISNSLNSMNVSSNIQSDEGITTKGEVSNQKFVYGTIGKLEENSHVITIYLKGTNSKGKINDPITVKKKISCSVCGTSNRSNVKYCSECGTYLW